MRWGVAFGGGGGFCGEVEDKGVVGEGSAKRKAKMRGARSPNQGKVERDKGRCGEGDIGVEAKVV